MSKVVEYKLCYDGRFGIQKYLILCQYETRNSVGRRHSFDDEPAYIGSFDAEYEYIYQWNVRCHREDAPARIKGTDKSITFEWHSYNTQYEPKCKKL